MLPATFRKMVCHRLTTNFRDAVRIVEAELPRLRPDEILIKNKFVGINASDINFTAGRYFNDAKPPFDTGFEGVGEVVAVGDEVRHLKVGQAVGYFASGNAFAEFSAVPAKVVAPIPEATPDYVPLLVSGLTAAIALEKVGELKPTDTVLVTAAAGGTGQFAVQWAKQKGCRVLGTCSTDEKISFLKSIGCDRAINYKTEDLHAVLQKECPNGVDVIYESVGGKIFETCAHNLATHGRLIIIGAIVGYQGGKEAQSARLTTIPLLLLTRSASLRGFFLPHYYDQIRNFLPKLVSLRQGGKLTSLVDLGEKTGKPFAGLEDIPRAVEYLYSQQSVGKIVVRMDGPKPKL